MITRFEIDRSRWRTGRYASVDGQAELLFGVSSLLNKEGFQCCLGFFCEASGVSREALLGTATPRLLESDRAKVPAWMLASRGSVVYLAASNDLHDLGDAEREERVRVGFAREGVTVTFVGEYPTKF